MTVQNLNEYIQEAERTAREVFEELHSWPELADEEFRTVTLIGKKMKELGLSVERPLPTAVVVNIKGDASKEKRPLLAFRADLDALPVTEEAMVSFRSRRAGMMHACGHDAHTAVLTGLAQVLCRMGDALPCDVRLIFQPAEEGKGGARRLIKTGVLSGVDRIFGFHVKPELHAGTIGIQYGIVHGESRMFKAYIEGAGAHGARPDLGQDAIYAAAEFISMCQGIISRDLDPVKAGVITFGKIQGGESGNVLAQQAKTHGIVRGEDPLVCDFLCSRMQVIARGLSQVMGVRIELCFEPGYPALINEDVSVEQIRRAAAHTEELKEKSMTADDFSFYLKQVPGAYFFLGCGFEGRKNSSIHTGRFQVNEICLAAGIEVLTKICMNVSC